MRVSFEPTPADEWITAGAAAYYSPQPALPRIFAPSELRYARPMRVVLVVAANKWTGAGAVAELQCRALRAAGVEASLLFVGGRNLERRLCGEKWAVPALVKERRPAHVVSNIGAIRDLARSHDIVVCHLPHDHLLCVAAGVHKRLPMVRAFRNPRHIRTDPYHRFLNRRIAGALVAHSELERDAKDSTHVATVALPVPVGDRFRPGTGGVWRERLGVSTGVPVIGAVGKLARGRGFELLLHATARLESRAHLVVVGHGERQPKLLALASVLGISDRVHWAGYRDESLPDLYRSMDIFVFPAPGSDWGHRAISEAQACGRPVIAARWPGVEDLIDDRTTGWIANRTPLDMAEAIDRLLAEPEVARRLGEAASRVVEDRRMAPIGSDLARFLNEAATL
jgi:glycosyltransferase involved in cell wall biosynthesis